MRLGSILSQTQVNKISIEYSNEILILFSNPLVRKDNYGKYTPCSPVSFESEIAAIEEVYEKFKLPKAQILTEVASLENIRYIFSRSIRPMVIHFIGHGLKNEDEAFLVIEDQCGLETTLTLAELESILKVVPNPPCQLAILNACFSSGLAKPFENAGVEHVIAINSDHKILDKAACLFIKYFYPLALNGCWSIQSAYESAQSAVISILSKTDEFRNQSCTEALKFQLHPLDSTIHKNSLVIDEDYGELNKISVDITNIDRVPHDPFIGREVELYSIISKIITNNTGFRRIFGVHGIGGIGKTALLDATVRWLLDRRKWPDGIWKLTLSNAQDAIEVFEQLRKVLHLQSNDLSSLEAVIKDKPLLLILDDIDQLIEQSSNDLIEILSRLTNTKRITVLLSSRRQLPGTLFYCPIHISKVDRLSALNIFETYSLHAAKEDSNEIDYMEEVIKFLDGYPFALRVAAIHLLRTKCGVKELLRRLQETPEQALAYRSIRSEDFSLFKTLDITLKVLPSEAKNMFYFASIYPSGVSDPFVRFVFGDDFLKALEHLYEFSMIEIERGKYGRRFVYLEPARSYAKSILPGEFSCYIKNQKSNALVYYCKYLTISDGDSKEEKFLNSYLIEEANIYMLLDWAFSLDEDVDVKRTASELTYRIAWYRYQMDWFTDKLFGYIEKSIGVLKNIKQFEFQFELYFLRGLVYEGRKEFPKALKEYKNAEKIAVEFAADEKKFDAQYKQGLVYQAVDNLTNSLECLNEACNGYKMLELNDKMADCMLDLAKCYYKADMLVKSRDILEQLRPISNKNNQEVSLLLLEVYAILIEKNGSKNDKLTYDADLKHFVSVYRSTESGIDDRKNRYLERLLKTTIKKRKKITTNPLLAEYIDNCSKNCTAGCDNSKRLGCKNFISLMKREVISQEDNVE